MKQLRRCPRCTDTAQVTWTLENDFIVVCSGCGLDICSSASERDVIAQWNFVSLTAIRQQLQGLKIF